MNTKMVKFVAAAVCAASLVSFAQEVELEEENADSKVTFGVDIDMLNGYVWRHSVSSDGLVLQPSVWAEVELCDALSFGGFVWQNYDLTHRRGDTYKYGITETDYNVHFTYTAWESDEECENPSRLTFEFGHDWYTYHGVRNDARNGNPDTREIYLKMSFENEIITPYAQVSWMYEDFGDYRRGVYYEIGFNKEVMIQEIYTLGADWSIGLGDKNYNDFLFGEDKLGFGGTTVKVYGKIALTEWASIKGTIGYTGVINGSMRNSIGDEGDEYDFYGSNYPRDLLWGGISLNLEF